MMGTVYRTFTYLMQNGNFGCKKIGSTACVSFRATVDRDATRKSLDSLQLTCDWLSACNVLLSKG